MKIEVIPEVRREQEDDKDEVVAVVGMRAGMMMEIK